MGVNLQLTHPSFSNILPSSHSSSGVLNKPSPQIEVHKPLISVFPALEQSKHSSSSSMYLHY